MAAGLTFAEAQARAWANKQAKGFNTANIDREFCLLMAELGEAYDAWRKTTRRPPWYRRILAAARIWPLPAPEPHRSVCLEIADVHIFALGLAQMLGIDSGEVITEKLAINEARQYQRLPGGTHARVERRLGS
jgi:NTP pyrophosphatase (non-canonical NTP hydrolase)